MPEVLVVVLSLVGSFAIAIFTSRREAERLKVETAAQLELQSQRLQAELRTQFMAEAAIRRMLTVAQEKRTFTAIRDRIGGFSDQELRQLLVRAGALRYRRGADNEELWGLMERNEP